MKRTHQLPSHYLDFLMVHMGPTPLGVFRKVQRDTFTEEVHGQIDMAKEQKGEGELDKLIRSLGTWDVG